MMILMAGLFRIEAGLKTRRDKREMTAVEFHQLPAKVRQRRSQKIIEQIRVILLTLDARKDVLPESEIGNAVIHAMNQWHTLIAFLERSEEELENNAAERAIRQVALGRKNWMFAGSAKAVMPPPYFTLWSALARCSTSIREPTRKT
jgi:hypothetical protein